MGCIIISANILTHHFISFSGMWSHKPEYRDPPQTKQNKTKEESKIFGTSPSSAIGIKIVGLLCSHPGSCLRSAGGCSSRVRTQLWALFGTDASTWTIGFTIASFSVVLRAKAPVCWSLHTTEMGLQGVPQLLRNALLASLLSCLQTETAGAEESLGTQGPSSESCLSDGS